MTEAGRGDLALLVDPEDEQARIEEASIELVDLAYELFEPEADG